jgi:hypothetical protein
VYCDLSEPDTPADGQNLTLPRMVRTGHSLLKETICEIPSNCFTRGIRLALRWQLR